jgi:hypothetical protein
MCHGMKNLVVVMAFVPACMLLLGLPVANADFVNGSFELPALAENGYITGVADNWSTWNFHGWVINGNNASGDGMYAPADGNQFQEFSGWVGQNTAIPLLYGNTYTLSCEVNRGNLTGMSTVLHFDAVPDANPTTEGTTFASQTYSEFAASTWTGATLSATYTGDPGKYLGVWVKMDGNFGGLDAVTLSVQTPEPSAVTLLTAGLLALLAYAWRKR